MYKRGVASLIFKRMARIGQNYDPKLNLFFPLLIYFFGQIHCYILQELAKALVKFKIDLMCQKLQYDVPLASFKHPPFCHKCGGKIEKSDRSFSDGNFYGQTFLHFLHQQK